MLLRVIFENLAITASAAGARLFIDLLLIDLTYQICPKKVLQLYFSFQGSIFFKNIFANQSEPASAPPFDH